MQFSGKYGQIIGWCRLGFPGSTSDYRKKEVWARFVYLHFSVWTDHRTWCETNSSAWTLPHTLVNEPFIKPTGRKRKDITLAEILFQTKRRNNLSNLFDSCNHYWAEITAIYHRKYSKLQSMAIQWNLSHLLLVVFFPAKQRPLKFRKNQEINLSLLSHIWEFQ